MSRFQYCSQQVCVYEQVLVLQLVGGVVYEQVLVLQLGGGMVYEQFLVMQLVGGVCL